MLEVLYLMLFLAVLAGFFAAVNWWAEHPKVCDDGMHISTGPDSELDDLSWRWVCDYCGCVAPQDVGFDSDGSITW